MKITQKQHLLAYLGYYTLEVDGIWGDGSKAATEQFQEDYGLDVDGIFGPLTEARIREVIATGEEPKPEENIWDGIKYFAREEFKCKCGGKYCDGYPTEMRVELLRIADRVREHFGNEAIVSSGVRCEKHNKAVGGVSNSRHLTGKAMDFRVESFNAATVLPYVQSLPGVRYAYAIDSYYVHMDVE